MHCNAVCTINTSQVLNSTREIYGHVHTLLIYVVGPSTILHVASFFGGGGTGPYSQGGAHFLM